MTELARLMNFMSSHKYSVRKLATETGMSYDGTYQILYVRERISPGFKVRFIARFGQEVADGIFDSALATQEVVTPVLETQL